MTLLCQSAERAFAEIQYYTSERTMLCLPRWEKVARAIRMPVTDEVFRRDIAFRTEEIVIKNFTKI